MAPTRSVSFFLPLVLALAATRPARAEGCPAAQELPQLTIHDAQDPWVPVLDKWQVFLDETPLSDAQLASLAQDDVALDEMASGMRSRGAWVYLGMAVGALGTAVSSAGWVLYGQDQISQGVTLPMGLGGVILGLAGILLVSHAIQEPVYPYVAPTPEHRLGRDEARELVAIVNKRLYIDICAAARKAQGSAKIPEQDEARPVGGVGEVAPRPEGGSL